MSKGRRFVFLVLDGVGIGALPDAPSYGDQGSDTLGNLSRVRPLRLPNFQALGLGHIVPLAGMPPTRAPLALPGRLACRSAGKDTTIGHWEHMGLVTPRPFPTYPQGFPPDVIGAFTRAIGREVLGNKPASGTVIIEELGAEHLATGRPIVYTSADSVFQIAAHVDLVPVDQLYEWCRIARSLLTGEHAVARVIARPFRGSPGAFQRTPARRDFSLAPPGPTYLDLLQEREVPVYALGKIAEIFAGRGVSEAFKVGSNKENLGLVRALLEGPSSPARFEAGLLLTNLVEFDMVWGHRNDVEGFYAGLQEVDAALPGLLQALRPGDRLLITADHGVDPTTPSTDHSREYAPLLLFPRPRGSPGASYEGWFSDTGATAFRFLTGEAPALAGVPIDLLRPGRGWRAFTATLPEPAAYRATRSRGTDKRRGPDECRKTVPRQKRVIPVRAGLREATDAAGWLEERLGPAPRYALVLGSGLASGLLDLEGWPSVDFAQVPGYRAGTVPGHDYRLHLVEWRSEMPILVQSGRLHRYEGFDDGERQLMVRTLAAWGVRGVVLTTASGGVQAKAKPGHVVMVTRILDFQHRLASGAPLALPATPYSLARSVLRKLAEHGQQAETSFATRSGRAAARSLAPEFSSGIHACMPGPHYETATELELLRALGVATVSMSLADETLAARDSGMEAAALAAVVNVGDTSHEEVLEGARNAAGNLRRAVDALFSLWRPVREPEP